MFAYVLVFPICICLISTGEALDVVVERSALAYLSSTMELRIFAELQHFFPDAQSRFRIETKELDIYVPSLKTGIEFDGAYWHQKTAKRDRRKNEFFA